jgi:hypothetical protein
MWGMKGRRPLAVAAVICGALTAMLGVGAQAATADPATAEIRGTIADRSSHAPIQGIEVCTLPESEGEVPFCDRTDSLGRFALHDLPAEPTRLELTPLPWLNYLPTVAGPFALSEGGTQETEILLRRAAEFKGKVTEAGTGLPVLGSSGVEVCALDANTEARVKCVPVGAEGEYVLPGLSTGSYVISFGEDALSEGKVLLPDGYARQYWDHVPRFDEAIRMLIEAGAVASDIDAELTPGPETYPSVEEPDPWELVAGSTPGGSPIGTGVTSVPNLSIGAPAPPLLGPASTSPPTLPGKPICAAGYHRVTKGGQTRCVRKRKAPRRHKPRRHRKHRATRA